jgi:hypothetical protein
MVRLAVDEPAISLKHREGTISTPFRKIFAIICLSPVSSIICLSPVSSVFFRVYPEWTERLDSKIPRPADQLGTGFTCLGTVPP